MYFKYLYLSICDFLSFLSACALFAFLSPLTRPSLTTPCVRFFPLEVKCSQLEVNPLFKEEALVLSCERGI